MYSMIPNFLTFYLELKAFFTSHDIFKDKAIHN